MSSALLAPSLILLGALIGPLVGVVVDRAVERLKLKLEHRCSHCQAGLGIGSLKPIVGWLDRCYHCSRHKGFRYVAVDLAMMTLLPAVGVKFADDWRMVPYLLLAMVLIALSVIDIETHLLPNIIVWPAIWCGLFIVLVGSGLAQYEKGINLALGGAAMFGGFIGLVHIIYEAGMGRGDVKLSLLLGLFVGWIQPDMLTTARMVLVTILAAMLIGGLSGLAYNLIMRRGRSEIPFGPALAVATMAVVLLTPGF